MNNDGWDSVTPTVLARTALLLVRLPPGLPEFWAVPDDDGGVSIEWHFAGNPIAKVFIEIDADDRVIMLRKMSAGETFVMPSLPGSMVDGRVLAELFGRETDAG